MWFISSTQPPLFIVASVSTAATNTPLCCRAESQPPPGRPLTTYLCILWNASRYRLVHGRYTDSVADLVKRLPNQRALSLAPARASAVTSCVRRVGITCTTAVGSNHRHGLASEAAHVQRQHDTARIAGGGGGGERRSIVISVLQKHHTLAGSLKCQCQVLRRSKHGGDQTFVGVPTTVLCR